MPPKIFTSSAKFFASQQVRLFILAIGFTLAALFSSFGVLDRFDYVLYDFFMRTKLDNATDSRLAMLDLSHSETLSIANYNEKLSTYIKILNSMGAKAIVVSAPLVESGDSLKDAELAKSIEFSGNVYIASIFNQNFSQQKPVLYNSSTLFLDASKPAVFVSNFSDEDGVIRKTPLLITMNGRTFTHVSLAVFLDRLGVATKDLKVLPDSISFSVRDQNFSIPLANNQYMVHWLGGWNSLNRYYTGSEIQNTYFAFLKNKNSADIQREFKETIFFIRTQNTTASDLKNTSVDSHYPLAAIEMVVLDNLLQKRFIYVLSYYENIAIWLLLLVLIFYVTKSSNYSRGALGTLILWTTEFACAWIGLVAFNVWIGFFYSAGLTAFANFFISLYNHQTMKIERGKLLKLATRDTLTGLYNVGHFKLLLKAEITTLSLRRDRNVSLLMIDVDDFKLINDAHGHLVGDMVLRETASIIKNQTRALDVVARYGGEEFIVLLPGASVMDAFKVAERMRRMVHEKEFTSEKGVFNISISIGITQINPEEKDLDAIIARADKALYEVKQSGKNSAVIASENPKMYWRPQG